MSVSALPSPSKSPAASLARTDDAGGGAAEHPAGFAVDVVDEDVGAVVEMGSVLLRSSVLDDDAVFFLSLEQAVIVATAASTARAQRARRR
jgi:hypothetical protein